MDLATVDKLLTTTRTVRKRLDFTRPVAPEDHPNVSRNGHSGTDWRDVPDTISWWSPMQAKRGDLAALYKRAYFEVYSPQRQVEVSQSDPRLIASATYLAEHMHDVPVLIIPCVEAAVAPWHGTRSLCQYLACHLVPDAGAPCSWSGISLDDAASPL